MAISMLGSDGIVEDAVGEALSVGRIDAAIYRPNDLLVVFEIKVGSSALGERQLDQHGKKWGIARSARRYVRWEQIYAWCEQEIQTKHDAVSAFLLAQFLEFLELTGLAPFRGFRDEDFDFFITRVPERQPIVKDRLAALGTAVVEALTPAERAALGEVHVGQLRDSSHAWLCTHYGEDVVNLTLELHADELQVNVVGWSHKQARRFEQWLGLGGLESLNKLHNHLLIIYERNAFNIDKRGKGARPWWQQERSRKVGACAAPQVTRAWIARRLPPPSERSWQKPGFHLRRRWARGEVVRAREQIVADVVDGWRAMLPLVTEINTMTNHPVQAGA